MRPSLSLLPACLVGLALVVPAACAQEQTITVDLGEPPGITWPAAPQAPSPLYPPAPAAPGLEYYPTHAPPAHYSPRDSCSDGSTVWGGAELLLWWVRRQPVPALVTAGPPGGAVLAGGSGANGGVVPGARFTLGAWFDDGHTVGVQAGYFFLGGQDSNQTVVSLGSPQLFRPFFNLGTGQPAAAAVGLPGGVAVLAGTDGLRGGNLLLRENLWGDGAASRPGLWWWAWLRFDLLMGYSFLHLQESLAIHADLPPDGAGNRGVVSDSFRTRNEFHGGQVGLLGEWRQGPLLARAEAALALGATLQSVLVEGATAAGRTVPGGLLAQPVNIGMHHRSSFSAVPQLALQLAYEVRTWARLMVGYNVLWWTGVARPGDQVNPAINPGAPRLAQAPPFAFHDSDLWAQGLSLGLELSY